SRRSLVVRFFLVARPGCGRIEANQRDLRSGTMRLNHHNALVSSFADLQFRSVLGKVLSFARSGIRDRLLIDLHIDSAVAAAWAFDQFSIALEPVAVERKNLRRFILGKICGCSETMHMHAICKRNSAAPIGVVARYGVGIDWDSYSATVAVDRLRGGTSVRWYDGLHMYSGRANIKGGVRSSRH